TTASIDVASRAAALGAARASMRRAIALAPGNPLFYRGLAVMELAQPAPRLDLALAAAREAVRRDAKLLPELVASFLLAALAARGASAALDAHRAAVRKAEARARGASAFAAADPRARAVIARALGAAEEPGAVRYRRALAQYLLDRRLWAEAVREWDRVVA